MKIVVCGGGIMGCATAYYLTKLGQTDVTIVERLKIAGCASGKAGGFLAEDWCDHGPLGPLARKSFQLHGELAGEMGTDIGYRKMEALSVEVLEDPSKSGAQRRQDVPAWIDGACDVKKVSSIGTTATAAQVHPRLLTEALAEAAKRAGASIVIGEVVGVRLEGNAIRGVVLQDGGQVIPADVVMVAMGPWSGIAREWFPGSGLPEITGNRAHSIVLDVKKKKDGAAAAISPHALFLDYNGGKDPEVYPRPDGTVYVCGNADGEPLPKDPSAISPNEASCNDLVEVAGTLSKVLKESECVARQACYLPSCSDGRPVIGKVPKFEGAYIAAGHTCWGILNGPATGLAMAEMIANRTSTATSVKVKDFDPARFL